VSQKTSSTGEAQIRGLSQKEKFVSNILWGVSGAMVILAVTLTIVLKPSFNLFASQTPTAVPTQVATAVPAAATDSNTNQTESGGKKVVRALNPHTVVDKVVRRDAEDYTVEEGDSIFNIAKKFDLAAETVFWANYNSLGGSIDALSPGMTLVIPPYDGIYYKWKSGDSFQALADKYYVDKDTIITSPYNKLDLSNPTVEPDSYIMIPGGQDEMVDWFASMRAETSSGGSYRISGEFGCTNNGGAVGDGFFGNPVPGSVVIGNDYISGVHDGIDLGSASSNTVVAADDGVVVYAGWSSNGYGNVVEIDHGDGYQTVYAHLSVITVSCGQAVGQGAQIGVVGSTGNSTGPHLHFEVRYNGVADNPHNYF
jgi:murein DD-endopeptidase MepM/ murein hydrolase activator NlpD